VMKEGKMMIRLLLIMVTRRVIVESEVGAVAFD